MSFTKITSSPPKTPNQAISCLLPCILDVMCLDSFTDQKIFTLLSTPDYLLEKKSMNADLPERLHVYLKDPLSSIQSSDDAWLFPSQTQELHNSQPDSSWLPSGDSLSLDLYTHLLDSLSLCESFKPSFYELDSVGNFSSSHLTFYRFKHLPPVYIHYQYLILKLVICQKLPSLILAPISS